MNSGRILWTLVALLVISQAYFLYKQFTLDKQGFASMSNKAVAPEANTTGSIKGTYSTQLVFGEVVRASGSTLVLKTQSGEVTYTIDDSTQVVALGSPVDNQIFQKKIEDYNKKKQELMSDPEGNKRLLMQLYAPTPFTETKITLEDLTPGQTVNVGISDGLVLLVQTTPSSY